MMNIKQEEFAEKVAELVYKKIKASQAESARKYIELLWDTPFPSKPTPEMVKTFLDEAKQ